MSTIAVGSPPPNDGYATSWAGSVKASPVPIRYELKALLSLFTTDLMRQFISSESSLSMVQNKLRELESLYSLYRTIADSSTNYFDDTPVTIPGVALNSNDVFQNCGVDQDDCFRHCEETVCPMFTYFTGGQPSTLGLDRCNLGQSPTNPFSVNVEGASSVIAPKSLRDDLMINGLKYDGSAKRGRKFNIKPRQGNDELSKLLKSPLNLCGRFCRAQNGCRGYEIAEQNSDYAYNCVLYETLGTAMSEAVDETDFHTVFVSSNHLDTNTFDSLKPGSLFNLSQKLNVTIFGEGRWVTDKHCDQSCLANKACFGIGLKQYTEVKNCLHLEEGSAQRMSAGNSSTDTGVPMTVAIMAERIVNDILFIRDVGCLNSTDIVGSYDAKSVKDCADQCAENGLCIVSFFDGNFPGTCYLHDVFSFYESEFMYSPGSVLIFPSLMERMKATEIL